MTQKVSVSVALDWPDRNKSPLSGFFWSKETNHMVVCFRHWNWGPI